MAFWHKKRKDDTEDASNDENPPVHTGTPQADAGDSMYSNPTGRFNPNLWGDHMGTGVEGPGPHGIPEAGVDTDADPAHVGADLQKDVDEGVDNILKWNQEDERI